MGLSRTVFEINSNFSRKSQIFRIPVYLTPPLKEFLLELRKNRWPQETGVMALPGREKRLTIFIAVWIQCTSVTDGQTDTGRQV